MRAKKNGLLIIFFSRRDDFGSRWVKEPRHSEAILAKKRYTSMVARVFHSYPPKN